MSSHPHPVDAQGADLLARLAAAGITPEELAAGGYTPRPADPPMRGLVAEGLARLQRDQPGSFDTWGTYLRMLASGLPEVCACTCPACVGPSRPCPCTDAEGGEDGHAPACHPTGDTGSCASRYAGVGDKTAATISVDDIAELAWWAQRRALKRTVRRNLARQAAGDPPLLSDGRGAAESAIAGARWLFTWLVDNDRATRNPAQKVKLPSRQERPARSLEAHEIVEVYRVAVSTGRDPALDGLLVRHQLVQAVRRGGLLEAIAGGLDPEAVTVTYYDRKRKTHRVRPSTRRHMACLLAHVLERGPRVPAPADAPEEIRRVGVPAIGEYDPVFYRRPLDTFDADGYFLARQVRPVTRKHIESLFGRIKRHLPWARRRGLRPHDLRHSSARVVYRAADEQMARLHLAHDAASTTDHYLTEQMKALARLKEELFEPGQDGA